MLEVYHSSIFFVLNKRNHTTLKLENVAIANALQLEAARRRAVPVRFNFAPVPCSKSLSLSVAVLERFTASTLRYAVTLNFNPVTLTFHL